MSADLSLLQPVARPLALPRTPHAPSGPNRDYLVAEPVASEGRADHLQYAQLAVAQGVHASRPEPAPWASPGGSPVAVMISRNAARMAGTSRTCSKDRAHPQPGKSSAAQLRRPMHGRGSCPCLPPPDDDQEAYEAAPDKTRSERARSGRCCARKFEATGELHERTVIASRVDVVGRQLRRGTCEIPHAKKPGGFQTCAVRYSRGRCAPSGSATALLEFQTVWPAARRPAAGSTAAKPPMTAKVPRRPVRAATGGPRTRLRPPARRSRRIC